MSELDALIAEKKRREELEALLAERERRGGESTESSATRKASLFARGATDRIGDFVGNVADASAAGARAVGLPSTPPGYWGEKVDQGIDAFRDGVSDVAINMGSPDLGSPEARTRGEEIAISAGEGAGDALTFMAPGAAFLRSGGNAARFGTMLTEAPVLQTVAGSVAGGTQKAVGDDAFGQASGVVAGVATPLLLAALRRGVTPFPNRLNANEQRLANAAVREGVRLTPAQATGSKPLAWIESVFGDLPFTSGPQNDIWDAQSQAFNRSVLSRVGINRDTVTPELIDGAFDDAGRLFDHLIDSTGDLVPDAAFYNTFNELVAANGEKLSADISGVFRSYADDIMNMATHPSAQIPSAAYKKVRSSLTTRLRSTKDPELKQALGGFVGALDDLLARQAPPNVVDLWNQTRRTYRNLLTISDAAAMGTQAGRSSGDIGYGALTNAVRSNAGRRGYSRGAGDLNELSRVGDFLASKTPNSGTGPRNYYTSLLTGGSVGGTAGYAAGDPVSGSAVGAASTLFGPRAAQLVYNSPLVQAYLRNQLTPGQMPPNIMQNILGARAQSLLTEE